MFQKNTVSIVKQVESRKSNCSTTLMRQIMLVSGVAAITVLLFTSVKPEFTNPFQPFSSFFIQELVAEEPDSVSSANTLRASTSIVPQPHLKQQHTVANWLARRYRVADDAARTFVSAAYRTAKELKLDPLLILSVMAIESGLNPFAESAAGAQGLMQVMSKIHHDKFEEFGGIKAALDPIANIQVGGQILKEYVARSGSVKAGLKMYVGAALAEDDGGYGHKVLEEYRHLKDVSSGKAVPVFVKASVPVAVVKPAMMVINAEVRQDGEAVNEEMSGQVSERHVERELVAAI